MHGTSKWHGESALAWMIVILLHAVLWRELCRIDTVQFRKDAAATRLQLLWIHRESPRIVAAPQAIPSSAMHKPRIRAKANVQAAHDAAISPLDSNTPPPPTRSLSAVFLEQGLDVVAAVGQYLFAAPGYERIRVHKTSATSANGWMDQIRKRCSTSWTTNANIAGREAIS